MSWMLLKVYVPVVALPMVAWMAFALTVPGGPLDRTPDGGVPAPDVADVGSSFRHQDIDGPPIANATPTPSPSDSPPPQLVSSSAPGEVQPAEAPPLPTPPPPPDENPVAMTPTPSASPQPPIASDDACELVRAYVVTEMASVTVTFKSCSAAATVDGLLLAETKIYNPACASTDGPCLHHSLTLKLYVYEDGSIVPADAATQLILDTY